MPKVAAYPTPALDPRTTARTAATAGRTTPGARHRSLSVRSRQTGSQACSWIRLQRDTVRRQTIAYSLEFRGSADADRLIGELRRGVIANAEQIGDVAQGQVAGACIAQRRLGGGRHVHSGPRQRRGVHAPAPAAVIQERPGRGERKKLRAANEVWLSSMSVNHISQVTHCSRNRCNPWMRSSARSSPPRWAESRRGLPGG